MQAVPDSYDQVARRLAFEQAHPEVTIHYLRPAWQAIIALPDDGEQVITRDDLRWLLDELEKRLP